MLVTMHPLTPDFSILLALAHSPMTTAEINQQILADTIAAGHLKNTTLYRTIQSLTELGMIEPYEQDKAAVRKTYKLTNRSHQHLLNDNNHVKRSLEHLNPRLDYNA